MASYHLSVKVGKVGAGAAHASYIERSGRYESKSKDDLEHVESLNLPEWADGDSATFWRAVDENERANGTAYREFEIALPRELNPSERLALVREFVKSEIGDRHACTFAIHNPLAAIDGGEQPHAHIMYSERVNDGIKRATPGHYFKRADSKLPERGGCRKAGGERTTADERKAALIALRARFALVQNSALAKAGHRARVDHRSLIEQGQQRRAEPHIGPALSRQLRAEIRADRAAAAAERRKPQVRASAEVPRPAPAPARPPPPAPRLSLDERMQLRAAQLEKEAKAAAEAARLGRERTGKGKNNER